jgi:hypothetical protein
MEIQSGTMTFSAISCISIALSYIIGLISDVSKWWQVHCGILLLSWPESLMIKNVTFNVQNTTSGFLIHKPNESVCRLVYQLMPCTFHKITIMQCPTPCNGAMIHQSGVH